MPQLSGGRHNPGIPDLWVKLMQTNDYDWSMHKIYYELTTRRPKEKKIAYTESHDQALVGDKTLFFWLADEQAYWHMRKDDDNFIIDRAIALHKMMRFITLTTGQDGYLNFMGNEFGHPEWIDFPREGNGWSFHYARRQWHLMLDEELKYDYLSTFDRDMLRFAKKEKVFSSQGLQYIRIYEDRKVIVYRKNNLLFVYNFHPQNSYESLRFPTNEEGTYRVVFTSDRKDYGGYDRIAENVLYHTAPMDDIDWDQGLTLYLPSRTLVVLKKLPPEEEHIVDLDVDEQESLPVDEKEQQAINQMRRAEKMAQQALRAAKAKKK